MNPGIIFPTPAKEFFLHAAEIQYELFSNQPRTAADLPFGTKNSKRRTSSRVYSVIDNLHAIGLGKISNGRKR